MAKVNILAGGVLYIDVLYADFREITTGIPIIAKSVGKHIAGLRPVSNGGVYLYTVANVVYKKCKLFEDLLGEQLRNFEIPNKTEIKDVKGELQITYDLDSFFQQLVYDKDTGDLRNASEYSAQYSQVVATEEGLKVDQNYIPVDTSAYIKDKKIPMHKAYLALRNDIHQQWGTVFVDGQIIKYTLQDTRDNMLVFECQHRYLMLMTVKDREDNPYTERQVIKAFQGFYPEKSELAKKLGMRIETKYLLRRNG